MEKTTITLHLELDLESVEALFKSWVWQELSNIIEQPICISWGTDRTERKLLE